MKTLFTLLLAIVATCTAAAQIPNPSFENWVEVTTTSASPYTYHDPSGWGTFNSTSAFHHTTTCDSAGVGAPDGLAYAALTARIMSTSAINVPGMIVTGIIHITDSTDVPPFYYIYSFTGGFPITTRPANLAGTLHYGSHGGDRPHIAAFLWKWNGTMNKRDTIAALDTNFNMTVGAVLSWTPFSMPLKYLHGDNPDSGFILLSTSGATPVDGSTLNVDNLSFTGSVPNGVVSIPFSTSAIFLYPNPATGKTSIYYHSNNAHNVSVSLTDITGGTIRTFETKVADGENDIFLDLKNVAQGMYMVNLSDENGTIQKKLLIK